MKQKISIQIKAALLLIVFSMNTVIGFACAIDIDMGFNTHHHEDEQVTDTRIHIHLDGEKHNHHDKVAEHHHDSKKDLEKGGCCNDGVFKFQGLDKNLNPNVNFVISVPVFTAMRTSFFDLDIFTQELSDQKQIALFFHPPPPDIRILIQSFQI